jgi:hypothetical protein
VSGGELDTGRPSNGSDGGGVATGLDAGLLTDAAAIGADVLDDALAPVEPLLLTSLESAVHDVVASIAIKLTPNAAINDTLTPHLVDFF